MRNLSSQPNVNPPSSAYPDGSIRNKNNAANPPVVGTPIIEQIYGDIVEFFQKLKRLANITANGNPDNETNGHQLVDALGAFVDEKVAAEAELRYQNDAILTQSNINTNNALSALENSLGDAAYKNTGTTTGTVAAGNDTRLTDAREIKMIGGATLHVKTINIGTWDMDAVEHISVDVGVLRSKVKDYKVLIMDDYDPATQPNKGAVYSLDGPYGWSCFNTLAGDTNTYLDLDRIAGGIFDTTIFNRTDINRGYITIYYVD